MLINLENVSFRYFHDFVIKDLSISIENKGLTILKGGNGSGKTTVSKLMMGILKPAGGRVMIKGCDTGDLTLGQIGQEIGYLFQEPERQIFAATVEDEASFVLRIKGLQTGMIKARVDEMLACFGLDRLRDSFPHHLSLGEKQRLALAGILINDPGFLILDEPATSLDNEGKYLLRGILKDQLDKGTGSLIISHDPEFIMDLACRIIDINEGNIINDRKIN